MLLSADSSLDQRQFSNEQERLKKYEQDIPRQDINLLKDTKKQDLSLNVNETPCFNIEKVNLNGENANTYFSYLARALNKLKFKPGMCLGKESILNIHKALSNEILKDGFITTRVDILPTNLKKKKALNLQIVEGKIDQIYINDNNDTAARVSSFMAFGGKPEVLNLRDIELALETIQNSSKGEVDISLSPSQKLNFSNVNIKKQKKFPILTKLSIDNAGSKATGKYQGSVGLYGLGMFGLNEILYFSAGKNIFHGKRQRVRDDSKYGKNYNLYYGISLPFGNFLLDYNEYKYTYNQAIAGAFGVYEYLGRSFNRNLTLNYLYYRNGFSKNYVFFRLWEKKNKNFIQDYELDNQRKRTAGYEIGLNSQFYLDYGFLSFGASYKKSTGALGALKAPDEDVGGGFTRFDKYLANLHFVKSSQVLPLTYDLKINGVYSPKILTMQEKINLGGYSTIRGFDGEMSIVGDSGYSLQNTVIYNYATFAKPYLAFDIGAVFPKGQESETLSGIGIGLKGQLFKSLDYDLFMGRSLSVPEYFEKPKVVLNFNLTYTF
ncbi:MAG: ShlB/FhaC/HecB family hemolysin secretion/activation protein [Campylobacter sp.]|nr:ShlB/FhaC/HecB family hemolysin secretion/activation protein [Campylobacter sp.]